MKDRGFDFTIKNSAGQTPLMVAIHNQKEKVFNYLSLRTKDHNHEDKEGLTILTHLCLMGQLQWA